LNSQEKPDERAPQIVPRSAHTLSRSEVSKNALKVLYRLKDAGYQAFLVGGGVRDLLLGRHPKDFDVATDARPEEVRALFRNSRLIGRRFRLAHVRFGREIIEVATFRGSGSGDESGERQVFHESGRIISDNVYGTVEEDAWRRDLTINALYYNIADYSIWAFAGGLEDLEAKRLRLIGHPETRYREDPVRMLRAARFAAKLGFQINEDAAKPIPGLANLIDDVPPARLFDEFLKLFQTGYALESFRQLHTHGLFEHMFPNTIRMLEQDDSGSDMRLIEEALENSDKRFAEGKAITPMFLFGVFLWPSVRTRVQVLVDEGSGFSEVQALIAACTEVTSEQARRIALPRRFSLPMREMLQLQPRFLKRKGARAMNLLSHRRFRAAYDFMLLRSSVGEVAPEVADFWTEVQELPAEEQRELFGASPNKRPGRRRRRPRPAT
jgi:poly(A) polymerase